MNNQKKFFSKYIELDENLSIRHLTTCILKQFLFFRFKKGCATKKSKIGNQKNAFSKYTELDGNMPIRHLTMCISKQFLVFRSAV
jgi:hypothetical protein